MSRPEITLPLIWLGLFMWLGAAGMAVMFLSACRERNGWPWAFEVPLACIFAMIGSGGLLIAGGIGLIGP